MREGSDVYIAIGLVCLLEEVGLNLKICETFQKLSLS